MSSDASADLALVTTEVLVEEILRRSDHGVFVHLRIAEPDIGAGNIAYYTKWKGNTVTCAGLCAYAQQRIVKAFTEEGELREPPE